MTNKDRKLSAMDAADALDSTALLYAVQQPATNPKSVKLTFEAFTNWHGGLLKAGGTMTGPLTLAGAPTGDLHASTKGYVDAAGSTASAALAAAVTTLEAADAALDGAKLAKASNLSDLVSASSARTNLGLSANGSSLVTAADYAAMKVLLSLGEVDNTSDLNKPISTATQAALDAKQTLDADLTALAGLVSAGLLARTGAGTAAARTLTGTANEVAVTNGDGVAGAPTFSLPAALTFTGKTVTGGTFSGVTLSGATTLPGSGQIDSGGNVGIGAAPSQKLHVYDANTAITLNEVGAGGSGVASWRLKYDAYQYGAYVASTNALVFYDYGASAERMRLDSTGLGVGATAWTNLSVSGTTGVAIANGSNKGRLIFGDPANSTGYVGVYRAAAIAPATGGNYLNLGGYDGIAFSTGAANLAAQTERARVTSAGYWGFNCAPVTGIDMRIQAPGTSDAGLDIARASSTAVAVAGYDRTSAAHSTVYWGALQHVWQISGMQQMHLDTSGNLGIGKAPGVKLDVNGPARVASGTVGGYYALAYSAPDAASRSWAIYNDHTALGDFNILQSSTQTGSPNTSRLYISPAGNVGLGTTSPEAELHINGLAPAGAIRLQITNTSATGFGSIAFEDGTDTKAQIWAGNASYGSFGGADSFNYSANSGPHVWYNNYSEKMRLDASGNLGIGATPTAKIDINSDILRLRTAKTPASASDTGNAGDICWDADYLYVCIAANTWRRVAHATW